MEENKILTLDHVSFSYGETNILSDFSLSVERGSFTTLLGPSGCGKTTILRLMAGFLKPSSGRVFINGNDVTDVPVEDRKIGFVFQDFALFPHMTVRQNLLFGFKWKDRKNHKKDLEEICERLELLELLERYPHELSGGQQQRVALGRTLMIKPEIILMDEPLSSLDARLRVHVREELLEIQKKIGITTIYVTHDQEEALSLSSDIAVINEGKLLQFDTPQNVYFNPSCETVSRFTGMVNFLKDGEKRIMVRPEWFTLISEEEASEMKDRKIIRGEILSAGFLGGVRRFRISCDEAEKGLLVVDIPVFHKCGIPETGSSVLLAINSSVAL